MAPKKLKTPEAVRAAIETKDKLEAELAGGDESYISKANAERMMGKEPKSPAKGRGRAVGVIDIPPSRKADTELVIVGESGSSLIVHKWMRKMILMVLAKQMGWPVPRRPKDPHEDYVGSMLAFGKPEEGYGIPGVSFKNSAAGAAKHIGLFSTSIYAALHVMGDAVQILGSPNPRMDMVRLESGVADIRFRGEFKEWAAIVPITFDPDIITPQAIIHLFQKAGTSQGVGEWRPEKGGEHGMFHVATEAEARVVLKAMKPADRRVCESDRSFTNGLLAELREMGYDPSVVQPDEETGSRKTKKGKSNGAAAEA